MSKVVLYMSTSLDRFIAGPDDEMDHGLRYRVHRA
jgi:hypothetical protein